MSEEIAKTYGIEQYYLKAFDNMKNNLKILKCFSEEKRDEVLIDVLKDISKGMRGDMK